ncbi:MAG: hypothetical protein KC619_25480 [Myxococcales bacterium]|nr:hypothetical protein [Myxococcales bacterium]
MEVLVARRVTLGTGPRRVGRSRALRLVAVVALDCEQAAACLGIARSDAPLWPSSVYAWLAEAASRSPAVWRRSERALDAALAPWMAPYVDRSAAAIAQALLAPESVAIERAEIAAALWALVRRRDAGLDRTLERLACEAEVLVARR